MTTMAHPAASGSASPGHRPPMRFHVDGWDPSYGSSVEAAVMDLGDSSARVEVGVEVDRARWAPIPPRQMPAPGAILFVDGVRRIDARAWIEDTPANGAGRSADASMALCASYAAGTVCCCPAGAHPLTAESRRGLFTIASHATDVATSAGTYRVNYTLDDPAQTLAVLLSEALQRRLGELEIIVAANARASLPGHGVAPGSDLLVVDGPLRGRTHLPRALGLIKTHRAAYLEPELHAMVARLAAGERTPVFLMGTSWDRHSWYLRLPCMPGAPWAGVVRVECSADIPATDSVNLANLSQAVLPPFASCEYKDARAPQNLVPVAGLERGLRHQLGNPALLARALRVAAAGR